VFDHASADFARDTLSEVVAGLLLMGLGGLIALFRHLRSRITRQGIEIRHTQKETNVTPFFPEYPADEL
jgi:hypothetical protein